MTAFDFRQARPRDRERWGGFGHYHRTTIPEAGIEASSGNLFGDLQVPDAHEALAKATLPGRICALLSERKLTQTRAAVVLGIDQPKVSALVRGRLEGFSIERLVRLLNALGQDVEIVVRQGRPRSGHGSLHVVSV
jgi:predicted XRE-type DNA-binding protein